MASSAFGITPRSKRVWTPIKDEKLIEALLEMHQQGKYTADRGFKPGFLEVLEQKIATTLPNSGIKGIPHIKSRLKTLKTNFNTVNDMIIGNNTSGFGWDPVSKMITAEKAVWDAYLVSHKAAAQFKDRPFPNCDNLAILFSDGRATGQHAFDPVDMTEDTSRPHEDAPENFSFIEDELIRGHQFVEDDPPTPNSRMGGSQSVNEEDQMHVRRPNSAGRKRRRLGLGVETLILESQERCTDKMAAAIDRSSDKLATAISSDDEHRRQDRQQLLPVLREIPGLSTVEKIHVATIIAGDESLLALFLSASPEEKVVICHQ